mmetsp:Transcript_29229/g.61166  ORF Transcript_29229/g.61166 Transcript_29229/m.61166 type:complete len:165 (-) Transcript_29229:1598-2092(-)
MNGPWHSRQTSEKRQSRWSGRESVKNELWYVLALDFRIISNKTGNDPRSRRNDQREQKWFLSNVLAFYHHETKMTRHLQLPNKRGDFHFSGGYFSAFVDPSSLCSFGRNLRLFGSFLMRRSATFLSSNRSVLVMCETVSVPFLFFVVVAASAVFWVGQPPNREP